MINPLVSDIDLVIPTELDNDKVLDYKKEFVENSEYIPGSASLGSADKYESWLASVHDQKFNNPKAKMVPATQFLVVRKSDGKLVGMVSIRHELNEYLNEFGGHIGYSVRKSERRQGYATRILKLALDYCRTLGIARVLITCDKENVGSATVIKLNGGKLENETARDSNGSVTQRYWIDLL